MIAVLQFDATDVGLLRQMLEDGRLPVLASLAERGAHVRLTSPAVDLAAASFQTLYTGLEPGEHGHYYPFQWEPGNGRITLSSRLTFPPPVWEAASEAGRRVLVVDPYESPSPTRVGTGAVVSGIGFRERVVLPRWAVPAAAGRWARKFAGASPTVTETFGLSTPEELERLAAGLLSASSRTASAAIAGLSQGRVDLAWVGLSAGHLAGHQLRDLDLLEEVGLEIEPDRKLELSTALERIYEATDEAIGRICESLPPGAQTAIVSPLGMDRNTSRADLLPDMLGAVLGGGVPEDGGAGLWRMRAAVPASLRAAVASAIPDRAALAITAGLETRALDRSAAAFALPADGQGFIRFNVRGRELGGVVEPGEVDELHARIESGLRSFSDLGGGPCVERIIRTSSAYPGPAADRLPDLVVGWTDEEAVSLKGVTSSELGEIRRRGVGSGRVGNHPERADAWAIVSGGSVEPSSLASVADVARRISSALGLEPTRVAG